MASPLHARMMPIVFAAPVWGAGCADAHRGAEDLPTLRGPGLPSALTTQPPAAVLPSPPRTHS